MKINPIAIQSYQQSSSQTLTQREIIKNDNTKAEEANLTITPKDEMDSSKLAVKVNSDNFAKYLSTEEKNALELLFDQYRNSDKFGSSYNADIKKPAPDKTLGSLVDIKV